MRRPPSFVNDYGAEGYTAADLPQWIAAARRQQAKDRIIMPRLAALFARGRTLELGAGAGQIALLLRELGLEVVASDYVPAFVEHMRTVGLEAYRVDALDIAAAGLGRFATIFSQSISPFITSDYTTVAAAYRSSYEALEPDGRFVMIHAMAPYRAVPATMRRHQEIAVATGFRDVQVFRNQLLPSPAYRPPFSGLAALLESALGRHAGVRFILVGTR